MKKSMKKKFLVSFVLAGLAFLSTGCNEANGWDAIPVDNPEGCFQLTEWKSEGFPTQTKTWALGTYCPPDTKEVK